MLFLLPAMVESGIESGVWGLSGFLLLFDAAQVVWTSKKSTKFILHRDYVFYDLWPLTIITYIVHKILKLIFVIYD